MRWIARSARDDNKSAFGALFWHRAAERTIHLATFLGRRPRDFRLRCGVRVARLARPRPENIIPERRADAVTDMVVFVMMTHVILLQPKTDAALHGEMVRRVMNHVVTEIPNEQTGIGRRREISENAEKQPVKNQGERDADDGRHD